MSHLHASASGLRRRRPRGGSAAGPRHRHRAGLQAGGRRPARGADGGDPGAARPPAAPRAGPALARRVAISVCDITRAQPRREMLAALFAEMPDIPAEDITILIATGTHRTNTPRRAGAHARRATSSPLPGRSTTTAATRVARRSSARPRPACRCYLNREWLDADVRITTGFVEPHFFAGFSGGPKMVAPGLAGLETVLVLHDARRIGHPNATWGITEGNPIHDDVREIARMVGVDFAVDVTLNREQKITAVVRRRPVRASTAPPARARSATRCAPVDAPFDVVLTTNSGFPLDQNLYQAVKGMSAAAKVVKPGGTIVCAAECRDGLPSHGLVRRRCSPRSRSPAKLLAMITRARLLDARPVAGADPGADAAEGDGAW